MSNKMKIHKGSLVDLMSAGYSYGYGSGYGNGHGYGNGYSSGDGNGNGVGGAIVNGRVEISKDVEWIEILVKESDETAR